MASLDQPAIAHSARNAAAGSILVTPRAGSQIASSRHRGQEERRRPSKTAGSRALMPGSIALPKRVSANASGRPDRDPGGAEDETLTHDEADHLLAARAESHAHRELVGAAAHGVGGKPVDAHQRDRDRDRGVEPEHLREDAAHPLIAIDGVAPWSGPHPPTTAGSILPHRVAHRRRPRARPALGRATTTVRLGGGRVLQGR